MGTVSTGGGVSLIGAAATAENEVVVNGLADLPAASGGEIQLDDNLVYDFSASVALPCPIRLGANNVITSRNTLFPLLSYAGVGDMFIGVDINVTFRDILISCPAAQFLSLTTTTGPGNILIMGGTLVLACAKYATFTDMLTVDATDSSCLAADDGITATGSNWSIFSLTKFALFTTSATFTGIDFTTSVHRTLELTNFILRGVAGGVSLKGLAASGNVDTGCLASVSRSEIDLTVLPLSGIATSDIRWSFAANSGIPNSFSDSLWSISGNATETVIGASDTPVKMVGTWTNEDSTHFTFDATGKATYIKEIDAKLPITCTLGFNPASGTNILLTAYIAINGTVVAQTGVQENTGSTRPSSVTCIWQHNFTLNDFVEMYVENNSNTTNIVGVNSVMRIN